MRLKGLGFGPSSPGASRHPLTSSALPAGPVKLGGEAAHLPHLRPLPENQPSSSPLLQTAPGVKGHQRVVTLAQHISVTTCSLPHLVILAPGGTGPGEGMGNPTAPLSWWGGWGIQGMGEGEIPEPQAPIPSPPPHPWVEPAMRANSIFTGNEALLVARVSQCRGLVISAICQLPAWDH